MNAAQVLLTYLRERGVRLWVEGGRLRYRAPKGALSPKLLEELARHKAALLPLLDNGLFAPIPPVPEQDSYELSPAQRRLWVLAQLEEGAAYNVPLHQRLSGKLDRAALEAAFARLIVRHESLRTCFVTVAGEPRQKVHAEGGWRLGYHDLSRGPDPEVQARRLAAAETRCPFDLARGPLLRAQLLKLAESCHVLLLTLHHIACDGISIALLGRELGALYTAFHHSQPDPLPPLRIQYRDYAHWQNALLESPEVAPQRDYWLEKLGGEPPALDLPLDHPRPAVQTFNGWELSFLLDASRTQGLRALGRRHNASLYTVLLALVKVLLHRYTGQRDITVGSPCAGRCHPDLDDQIGCYLNMLALRDHIDPEQAFTALLEQVRCTVTEALDHQIYPFDRLIDGLKLARDLSRSPLFEVTLILQNQADTGFAFEGLEVCPCFEHPETSKTDLTFCGKEVPAGLILSIEYNTDLFRENRIQRMGSHFCTLVDSVLVDPAQPVVHLALLPAEECRQILYGFNATATAWPRAKILPALVQEQAARRPQAVAVVCGERQLSYQALDRLANGLAWRLRALGARPDQRVGLCVERSPQMLVGLFGILKAGAAYLPLDPAYPRERLAFTLEDASAGLLLTEQGLLERLPAHRGRTLCLEEVSPELTPPPCPASPANLAYVVYTSGSTGRPKGVAVSHAALVNLLCAMAREPSLSEQDVLVALTTLAFDIAALELFLPLLTGARLVLADRETARDGARLVALLEREQATVAQATPTTWQALLTSGWRGGRGLKILCGGEALPRELAGRLLDRADAVWNLYGPTETTVWSTARQLATPAADDHQPVEPIGRPIANTRVYILDRALEPVPIGVPGELYIGGAGLARGYLNRPAPSAERFVPDPFSGRPGERLYRSGDLARWRPEGSLEFLGRLDQQVKIRGFRVEPGEVEAALIRHPGVTQAVVVTRDDPPDGRQLVAYVVPAGEVAAARLRQLLAETLPEFMVPSAFVMLDALPLTPNGKVDRKALPPPVPIRDTAAGACVVPRDALEQAIAAAWQAVLGVPQVGIHDDFFALGGHSLKAARLVSQLRQEADLGLRLSDVFRQPTVAGLAAAARCRGQTRQAPIHPLPGPVPVPQVREILPLTAEEREMLGL